jgi:GcrA cell cycle regulator
MTWTEERIEELVHLWDAGHSASVIGKKLGISKNAVVGKAHRLKLPSRPSPIRKGSGSAPRRRSAIFAKPLIEAAAPLPPEDPEVASEATPAVEPPRSSGKRTSAGQQSCAWPIGDPATADFHFCGEATAPGKPYCRAHCELAYVSKTRERESAAA